MRGGVEREEGVVILSAGARRSCLRNIFSNGQNFESSFQKELLERRIRLSKVRNVEVGGHMLMSLSHHLS